VNRLLSVCLIGLLAATGVVWTAVVTGGGQIQTAAASQPSAHPAANIARAPVTVPAKRPSHYIQQMIAWTGNMTQANARLYKAVDLMTEVQADIGNGRLDLAQVHLQDARDEAQTAKWTYEAGNAPGNYGWINWSMGRAISQIQTAINKADQALFNNDPADLSEAWSVDMAKVTSRVQSIHAQSNQTFMAYLDSRQHLTIVSPIRHPVLAHLPQSGAGSVAGKG
jgi:hypothetical protein